MSLRAPFPRAARHDGNDDDGMMMTGRRDDAGDDDAHMNDEEDPAVGTMQFAMELQLLRARKRNVDEVKNIQQDDEVCVECNNKAADLLFGSFALADPCRCIYCSECIKKSRLPKRCVVSHDNNNSKDIVVKFYTRADLELQRCAEIRRKIYDEWNLSDKDIIFTDVKSPNRGQFDIYLELREELINTAMYEPTMSKYVDDVRERFKKAFKEFIGKNMARVNEFRRASNQQVIAEENERMKKLELFILQDKQEKEQSRQKRREENRRLLGGTVMTKKPQQRAGGGGNIRYIRTMGKLLEPMERAGQINVKKNAVLARRAGGMNDDRVKQRSLDETTLGWAAVALM